MRLCFRNLGTIPAVALLLASFVAWQPALADTGSGVDAADSTVEESGDGISGFDKGFDVVIIRPLSAFALITGAVFFVPAVALSAPGGREGIDDAYDVLVKTPWDELAERPLGEI